MKTFVYKLRKLHPDAKFTINVLGHILLEYRVNDKLHNTKGPAIEKWSGDDVLIYKEHWINGLQLNPFTVGKYITGFKVSL